jgi:hypothetical protein
MDYWLLGLELTVYAVYLIGMTIVILLDNKPPQSTLAWLLTLYFLPFIGLFFICLPGSTGGGGGLSNSARKKCSVSI